MISMRRLGLILAIAVTTVTVGATPVQAAGGGCVDSTQNGWTISVCSSDDGTFMRTDYYPGGYVYQAFYKVGPLTYA